MTREEIPGNVLNLVKGKTVEYVSGEYRVYYYWVLPNLSRVKSDKYDIVDGDENMIFLREDGTERILLQSPKGDYDWDELKPAPQSAYDDGTFKRDFFTVSPNEFIITD